MQDDPYLEWLRANLSERGRSQSGLARHLGIDPSSVNRMVKGQRRLQTREIPMAADYFGVAAPEPEIIPSLVQFKNATVIGRAEAGQFAEVDDLDDYETRITVAVPVDHQFPQARMVLFDVSGGSMNALQPRPILSGDRVVAVAYEDVAHLMPLRDRMVVILQRTRDGGHLREWSVKQVELHDDRVEFHPRSNELKHKPIVVKRDLKADDGTTVEVIAVVRRILNEIPLS